MTCLCSHGVGLHDLRKDNTRGACSVHLGPRGTPCDCTTYRPRPQEDQ